MDYLLKNPLGFFSMLYLYWVGPGLFLFSLNISARIVSLITFNLISYLLLFANFCPLFLLQSKILQYWSGDGIYILAFAASSKQDTLLVLLKSTPLFLIKSASLFGVLYPWIPKNLLVLGINEPLALDDIFITVLEPSRSPTFETEAALVWPIRVEVDAVKVCLWFESPDVDGLVFNAESEYYLFSEYSLGTLLSLVFFSPRRIVLFPLIWDWPCI